MCLLDSKLSAQMSISTLGELVLEWGFSVVGLAVLVVAVDALTSPCLLLTFPPAISTPLLLSSFFSEPRVTPEVSKDHFIFGKDELASLTTCFNVDLRGSFTRRAVASPTLGVTR